MLRFLVFFITLLLYNISYSQFKSGIISGYVTDAETKESLTGANIIVQNLNTGTATDSKGFFSLTVPYAIHTLKISFIGYENKFLVLQVSEKERNIQVDIALRSKPIFENEVTVSAKRQAPSTVIQQIESKDVQRMPNLYNDALRTVQALSGVASNNELSTGYNVRGGGYDENSIYLNGFEIYRPFLLRNGIEESQSLINGDLVSNIKFFNGAYPVQFGDKMSSVLEVDYDYPESDTVSITARADLFNLGASVKTGMNNLRLSAGFRYAYPQLFTTSLQTRGDYNPSFSDFQTSGKYILSGNQYLEFTALFADNNFVLEPDDWTGNYGGFFREDIRELYIDYNGSSKYNYKTSLIGLRWNYKFGDFSNLKISCANYKTNEIEKSTLSGIIYDTGDAYDSGDKFRYIKSRFTNTDNKLSLNSYRLNILVDFKVGESTLSIGSEYRFDNLENKINEHIYESGDILVQRPVRTDNFSKDNLDNFSSFVNSETRLGDNILLNAGLRLLYYKFSDELLFSPRLSLSYFESPVNTFTLGGGYYYQPPFINELRANNFSQLNSQRAIHCVLGWERKLNHKLNLNSAVYYKDLDNIIPFYYDEIKTVYMNGNTREGYSLGFDVQVDGEIVDGMRSLLSYSYLDSKERDKGSKKYQRRLTDQTHTLSIFLQDKMPKHENWQAHVRFLAGSGLLFYNRIKSIDAETGLSLIDVDLNNPDEYFLFFRVDMGLSALFDFSNNKLLVVAEVLNVFNQYNYSGFDWINVFEEYNTPIRIPRILSKRFFNLRVELNI